MAESTQPAGRQPEFVAPDLTDPAKILRDRALAVLDSINIVRSIGVPDGDPDLRAASQAYQGCVQAFEVLRQSSEHPGEARRALERSVDSAEDAFGRLDRKVGMDHFKNAFDESKFTKNAIAHYARLLASRFIGIAQKRDRFDYLCTRLLRTLGPDGRYYVSSRGHANKLLNYIVPAQLVVDDPATCSAAVEYFNQALDGLRAFTTAQEFFDSGFYLDLYGYKIALKNKVLNPDIVYAAVAVNVAVSNRLRELLQEGGGDFGVFEQRLTTQELEVRKIFAGGAEDETTYVVPRARFEEDREQAAARIEEPKFDGFMIEQKRRERIKKVIMAIAIVVGASGSVWYNLRPHPIEQAAPQDYVRGISPILTSGLLVPNEGTQLFVGELDPAAWDELFPRQRENAVSLIKAKIAEQGIDRFVLQRNGAVAVCQDSGGNTLIW